MASGSKIGLEFKVKALRLRGEGGVVVGEKCLLFGNLVHMENVVQEVIGQFGSGRS